MAVNPAFLGHLARDPVPDPLFYLSNPHYLARGLTANDRILAALTHYRHEVAAFDDAYLADVYHGDGLALWSRVAGGVTYEIKLQPGHDALYEGGISVVLFVDGGRICVLTYTMVPASVLIPGASSNPVMFVSRKHLAHDHTYQHAFNNAFHRCMPAHLCLGALTGVALGLGHRQVFGIAPERLPSWCVERQSQFDASYRGFWESLAGRKKSELGYMVDVPLHMTPLNDLDSARRKRAMQRRSHIAAVQDSALAIIARHMRPPA